MKWGARIYGHVYGLGDPPWDLQAWDTFENHAGKRTSILSYGQPFGRIDRPPLANVAAAANVPLITVMTEGTSLEQIAAGDVDDQIAAMGEALAAFPGESSPVLRFAHEMNGRWYDYGYGHSDPKTYQRAFRRVYRGVKEKAPKARLCWCVNVIGGASVGDPKLWWPGAGYVDIIGVDGYNQSGQLEADVFGPTLAALRAISPAASKKPYWICETGCVECPTKREYLRTFLQTTVPKLKINALVYFNGDPVENGVRRTWPIESSTAATAGFREGISASRYEGALISG